MSNGKVTIIRSNGEAEDKTTFALHSDVNAHVAATIAELLYQCVPYVTETSWVVGKKVGRYVVGGNNMPPKYGQKG